MVKKAKSLSKNKERGRITVYVGKANIKYINKLIADGEYSTMSEIVRDALRLHKKVADGADGTKKR